MKYEKSKAGESDAGELRLNDSLLRHGLVVLLATVILVAATKPATAQEYPELPDIGDPTAAVLPLSKERKLGDVFVRELRSKLPVETDIELNEYLSSLGAQLVSAHPDVRLQFNFLLVNNPQINAFATIGGVIAVNNGLFLAAANESQLAGVLAHEIVHITQRHIARMLAKTSKFDWANVLAILSVIVAATYDSDLGQAGLYSSAAIPLDRQLQYSRDHEQEADRLAVRLMTKAGINPVGMMEFFKIMQAMGGPSQVPEFMRTHPLTQNRISDMANQLMHLRGNYRNDSSEFRFAKARLEALSEPDKVLLNKPKDTFETYRTAIALIQKIQPREASRLLESLGQDGDALPVQLALAQAKVAAGDYQSGTEILKRLNGLYSDRATVNYHYAQTLLKRKQPEQALAVLQSVSDQENRYPIINKLSAEIFAMQNKPWLSHEQLAEYYALTGHLRAASDQLDKALKSGYDGHAFQARVKSKRKKLDDLKELVKKPL